MLLAIQVCSHEYCAILLPMIDCKCVTLIVRIDEEESQAVITRFVAQKALSELWAHFPADLLASSIENCVQACETSADDKLIVPRPSMKSANAMTVSAISVSRY